jgi:hypothetical protein
MLIPSQMALYHPGCSLLKVLAVKEERAKTTKVTKNWTSKVGLSRFPNNAMHIKLFCSQTKRDFLKKIYTFKEEIHYVIKS